MYVANGYIRFIRETHTEDRQMTYSDTVTRGDKVKLNRQGARIETVLDQVGTSVITYENPNGTYHITKMIRVS